MKLELGLPFFFLLICRTILGEPFLNHEDERSGATRDFFRYLQLALHNKFNSNNYPSSSSSVSRGIPYRPVRRIGNEFLGKRSSDFLGPDSFDDFEESKRGVQRMGSEFLGKRSDISDDILKNYHLMMLLQSNPQLLDLGYNNNKNVEKRKLGSEFLGKRGVVGAGKKNKDMYMEWTLKRAGLGSEFLGKRSGGVEVTGGQTGQTVASPDEE